MMYSSNSSLCFHIRYDHMMTTRPWISGKAVAEAQGPGFDAQWRLAFFIPLNKSLYFVFLLFVVCCLCLLFVFVSVLFSAHIICGIILVFVNWLMTSKSNNNGRKNPVTMVMAIKFTHNVQLAFKGKYSSWVPHFWVCHEWWHTSVFSYMIIPDLHIIHHTLKPHLY